MGVPITVVSSKATQTMLVELLREFEARSGLTTALESIGGVDAARRVRAGETFDLVVLASDAIEKLGASGHIAPGSKLDLAYSPVAMAVRAGAVHPDVSSEEAVRSAVLQAGSIGYSTGPSGVALLELFARWGITAELRGRLREAPPGVPVGSLAAQGEVELGFQQLSELMNIEGIEVIGCLPTSIQIVTTFSAALGVGSKESDAARALLAFLGSDAAAEAKRRRGMEPANAKTQARRAPTTSPHGECPK